MTLFQLRAVPESNLIHVRLYLDQKGQPNVDDVIYYNDVPLAKVASFINASMLVDFDPAQDYLITLDRILPYTPIGLVLQIG